MRRIKDGFILVLAIVLIGGFVMLLQSLQTPTLPEQAAPQVWQATQAIEAMQATQWATGLQATQAAANLAAEVNRLEFQTQTLPYTYGLAALAVIGLLVIIGSATLTLVTAKAAKMRYVDNDEGVLLASNKKIIIPALSIAPVIEHSKQANSMQPAGMATTDALQLEVVKHRGNARIAGRLPRNITNNYPSGASQQLTEEPLTIEFLHHTGQQTAAIIDEVEGKLLEG